MWRAGKKFFEEEFMIETSSGSTTSPWKQWRRTTWLNILRQWRRPVTQACGACEAVFRDVKRVPDMNGQPFTVHLADFGPICVQNDSYGLHRYVPLMGEIRAGQKKLRFSACALSCFNRSSESWEPVSVTIKYNGFAYGTSHLVPNGDIQRLSYSPIMVPRQNHQGPQTGEAHEL
jgi:hypothetical protein